MKNYKLLIPSSPLIFFIIGILVINILSLGFISIPGVPSPSIQLAYSSESEGGEEGNDFEKEDSKEKGDDGSNDKSSPKGKSPLSLPPADGDNQEEDEEQEQGDNTGGDPPLPPIEKQEPPASFQNPRLVPQTIPLATGSDDNGMPTPSMPDSFSPILNGQLLPLQISNLCSGTIDCATLRIQMNLDSDVTSNTTSKDIPSNNIIAINIQRNNQSISSFTLNANETMTNLVVDPGQYNIIANMVDRSITTISKMSADCSGSLKVGETKTCTIII